MLFLYHNTAPVPRNSIRVRTEEFLITPLPNHLIFVNEYRELFHATGDTEKHEQEEYKDPWFSLKLGIFLIICVIFNSGNVSYFKI